MISAILYYCIIPLFVSWVGIRYGSQIYKKREEKRIQDLYAKTPKDLVILHCFPMTSLPLGTCIPWDLKIELFCRMGKIKYQKDTNHPFGVKSKTPWISINGAHVSDSHLILQFLKKKFDVNFPNNYTKEELSTARAVRVMLEERWYWAMPLWRFIRPDGWTQFAKDFGRVGSFTWPIPLRLVRLYWKRILSNEVNAHGIGRHSREERDAMFLGDLQTVSDILGEKKYILGNEPCEEDCAIFGQIAQAVWAYCERIRSQYWADEWAFEY
ncbi:Failed axon connections [Folsomia candida]|uniref:Failed axon connections n=1 Tax=Folsomia candida TaxID=158441 RepID=A0A226DV66_FOLCA|nr:Failed axon connections [Folsomia candida]